MSINKEVKPKNDSTAVRPKESLLAPIKIQNNQLQMNKKHSYDESGNKSPDTTKARKSKTQLPIVENEDENQLITKAKKKIYECSDHGKLIVLFAANLMCANQMVNWAQVIEGIGLEYKSDKLTMANIHKLYCLYYFKDSSINEAIKECDKAIKLFRSWKSIQGTALCYMLKAFLKLDVLPDNSISSYSESENEKLAEYTNELLEQFDSKIAQIDDNAQWRGNYLKIRATIQKLNEENIQSTVELIKALIKFFTIPVFSTEDERDEDFSPKAKTRVTVQVPSNSRLKVSNVCLYNSNYLIVKTNRRNKAAWWSKYSRGAFL